MSDKVTVGESETPTFTSKSQIANNQLAHNQLAHKQTNNTLSQSIKTNTMTSNDIEKRKGAQITLTSSTNTYKGYKGAWIDLAPNKKGTPLSTHVIILLKDDVYKTTCIRKWSWVPFMEKKPASYLEAACKDHSDLEKTRDKLCMKLVQLHFTSKREHGQELGTWFIEGLAKAYEKQMKMGPNAMYFHVNWTDDSQEEMRE